MTTLPARADELTLATLNMPHGVSGQPHITDRLLLQCPDESRPLRFLLVTNEFPHAATPNRGVFNLPLARTLAENNEVRAIVPRSWVDELKRGWSSSAGSENSTMVDFGRVEACYPTYYYPPKFFRHAYGWFLWKSLWETMKKTLRSYSPDVIVSYWAHPDGEVAGRLARMIGVPSVLIIGGSDVLVLPHDSRRRRRIIQTLQIVDAIVVVSQSLKETIVKFGIDPAKIHTWSRGVDNTIFCPGDRIQARQRLGIPVEGRKLLWVGRMVPVKGLDVLLRAAAQLGERAIDFHLYLVGNGPLQEKVRADSRRLGIFNQVTFVGSLAQEQIADWYRAADLTVLSSHSEGLPNVLRESLACGTTFVSTRVGGVEELANGYPKRLVPPGDSAALATGIEEMLNLESLRFDPVHRSPTWKDSATSFLRIVRPLVLAAQNPDRPWWIRPKATISATTGATFAPRRWRQFIRNSVLTRLLPSFFTTRASAKKSLVYLTFDDGPHPEHTPRLLEALRNHNIRATFFLIGRLAERYPELVRQIQDDGHDIGNHSFYHPDSSFAPTSFLMNGIARTDEVLKEIVGHNNFVYRPPHGKLTAWNLVRLWQAGKKVVLWNVDPRDYACRSADELLDWFKKRPLTGGDVVLFHDRLPYASAVIPHIAAAANENGLVFATIKQHLNRI